MPGERAVAVVRVAEWEADEDTGEMGAVTETVEVCGTVAVGLDAVERVGDSIPERVRVKVPVGGHPRARCEMLEAHGYPSDGDRAHIEPST